MIKKTISYTDYFGKERKEDFYFNLTKAELIEMEMTTAGGMEYYLTKITQEEDREKLFMYFKQVILAGYGEKSDDGRQFIKNDELRQKFVQCPAYDVLLMEFFENPEYAAKFINEMMPADLTEKVAELQANNQNRQTVVPMTNR